MDDGGGDGPQITTLVLEFFFYRRVGLLANGFYVAVHTAAYKLLQSRASESSDLRAEPFCQYILDVVYITLFVQVTSLISKWFWIAYLSVFVFAGYKLWGMFSQFSAMKNSLQPQVPDQKEQRKKRVFIKR